MTSKIKFYDVIVAINEYAFRTSPYPLILSLENHCNVDQQNKMAQIMKNVFKEKLLDAQIDPNETVHPRWVLRDEVIMTYVWVHFKTYNIYFWNTIT